MCQQWLSILGLLADIVGFLVIAYEWRRSFKYNVDMRTLELQDAHGRNLARQVGHEPRYTLQEEEETMAREFSKLHRQEADFRLSLFWIGGALIILGFLLQSIGSWPINTYSLLGLKNC